MRFCQSFMTELFRHIGPDTDIPAGDMNVGAREIGYMFGQYKRLANEWTGVLTGKGLSYGGSLIRPEATGYGAVYYLQEVLKHEGDTIDGKKIAISGYGNVGWGIMKKAAQLGAAVTYFAGPDGYIHDPDGVASAEKLDFILKMRNEDPMHCAPYAKRFPGAIFVPGEKCWGVDDVDIYMPAATQNDVDIESAKRIAASGVKYYMEVANMPTTNEALNFLRRQKKMIVAPSKAVNAGGVGVSALEMAQNSERLVWTADEVDSQLKRMMKNIHDASAAAAAEYGLGYDLVAGANIAGFKKVATAMMEQGVF
jgi:glutamate dehydrogenase (NADP+)